MRSRRCWSVWESSRVISASVAAAERISNRIGATSGPTSVVSRPQLRMISWGSLTVACISSDRSGAGTGPPVQSTLPDGGHQTGLATEVLVDRLDRDPRVRGDGGD